MNKEYIQAVYDLFGLVSFQKSLTREQFERAQKYFDIIEQALQRLKQIDNSNSSEALECLEKIKNHLFERLKNEKCSEDFIEGYKKILFEPIKQALQRLKSIDNAKKDINSLYSNMHQTSDELDKSLKDSLLKNAKIEAIENANPSEALECLEKLKGLEISAMPFKDDCGTQEVDLNDIRKVGSQLNTDFREYTDTIKQALIKEQELENENLVLKACIRDWEDDYEHLEYALHKEKEILKIIKEKRIDMWHLVDLLDQTYEMYLAFCKSEGYENDYILTQEEFELLKELVK